MYSWPNFKARFYQDNHLTVPTLIIHSEARYTRYHHRQVPFKNVQMFFLISVMLNMPFWNSHNLWSPPTPTINFIPIDSETLSQSNPELCLILVPNLKVLNPYWQITETKSKTWEFTERHLRKQNPKNFQKFHFGFITERHLRKQHPVEFFERILVI